MLAASARNVAPGGDRGLWRWLLPALVLVLVVFGALGVQRAAEHSTTTDRRAALAGEFSSLVARSQALGSAVAATHGSQPDVVRELQGMGGPMSVTLSRLQAAAPEDPQVHSLRTELDSARASVPRAYGSPAHSDQVIGHFNRLAAMASSAEVDLGEESRSAQTTLSTRLATTGGIGLLLALLLMWTFWAKRTRVALEQSERRFQSLLERSTELVAVVDDDQRIRFVTPVFERRLGYEDGSLIGTKLADLVHPDDRGALAAADGQRDSHWRVRHKDGAWHDTEAEWVDLRDDPAVGGHVVTMRDVSDRNELKDQLHYQAFHDGLTGLPNRSLFEDRVAHSLERLRRHGGEVAVLFIDLDDFKTVNDSLGHALGDRLLREFALRLGECTRRADTAARFGGDEFAVLIEGHEAAAVAQFVADRVHAGLERPVTLDEDELFMHASIGIAAGSPASTAEELIRNADIAMYAAKTTGKGKSALFEPSMHSAARKRLQLSSDLRRAFRDDQFNVKYQPLVRLTDGRMIGAEALLRWRHETLGEVLPLEFIPLAEETGMIIPIGRFVLEEACRQMSAWQVEHAEFAPDYISVNLSARQFQPEGQIVEHVVAATADAGLHPSHLMLEITESVLMTDREAIVRDLSALQALGVRIAIDDFGTGYSALSYLRQFPIDTVKMDRSFVHDLGEGNADSALIRSVVELGDALDMQIVAEGIEGQDQLDSVTGLRCDIGQGYFFSPPLDAEGMRVALLEKSVAAG
jgi:diguanylate cyclase (GGDEF)-like protein/PAS domain S-box-containing protein